MKRILRILTVLVLALSLPASGALALGEAAAPDTVLGVKDAQRYDNAFLGLSAVFGEDWQILSDAETAAVMGYAMESVADPALAARLRESGVVCDLYALAPNGSDNLNIQIEDLGALYGLVMGEDAYFEAALPLLEEALRQAGVTELHTEKETLDFAGSEHLSARLSGTLRGAALYERIVLVKEGGYMAIVTAFSLEPERPEEMLALFTAYGEDAGQAA